MLRNAAWRNFSSSISFIYFCIFSNFAGILQSVGPIYIIDSIRRCNELADKRDSKEKSYWLYANVVQLHN